MKLLPICLVLLASLPCRSDETGGVSAPTSPRTDASSEAPPSEPAFKLLAFRLSQLSVLQQGGATSFSGELAWSPSVRLAGPLGLRGHAGVAILRGYSSMLFGSLDGELLLTWRVAGGLGLEAGGGMQTWQGGASGTSPALTGGAGWHFGPRFLGFIDGIYADYSAFLTPSSVTHEIRGGIGISF
jgi:hypothetical protein